MLPAVEAQQIAQIALSALTAQPIGRVDRGEVSDNNEYPNARVVCLHDQADWENFHDGTELFLRPAPAADLAELVPDEITHADAPELQEIASSAQAIGIKGAYAGFAVGANWMRAAILRNIEEAK